MAPQDDLTAERAAAIAKDFPFSDHEDLTEHIIKALKTARQEALREAARLSVAGEMCDEPDHACGSLQRILDDIDRLAREGREG